VSGRSAFGSFIVPPERLTQGERVELLEDITRDLGYGRITPYAADWLRSAFAAYLENGGDLAGYLGLRPVRGSRLTPTRICAMRERDRALLRLSVAVGSDAQALRVLAGQATCPRRALPLLADLAGYTPRSPASFTRARQRLSRDRA
jgi:hypothetical protein